MKEQRFKIIKSLEGFIPMDNFEKDVMDSSYKTSICLSIINLHRQSREVKERNRRIVLQAQS